MDTVVNLNVTRLSHDNVQISIHDVGPDIAPDDVDKVFSRSIVHPQHIRRPRNRARPGHCQAVSRTASESTRSGDSAGPGQLLLLHVADSDTDISTSPASPLAPPKAVFVERIS